MGRRVFLIVCDSFGIGEEPDANSYGDEGSNTLMACSTSKYFAMPVMRDLGLFNIDGVELEDSPHPQGAFGRLQESSQGKDTTVGHWEIAGMISPRKFPTYPDGFPADVIQRFEEATGRKVLCNKPYSGTQVIHDYGREHMETGDLIVYTSGDSVFQVAAHTDVVPLDELYRICEIAREQLQVEHGVGRVIARPFTGQWPEFTRTADRHDFSLEPPRKTMLDYIKEAGKDVISVGKINDIFAGRGSTQVIKTRGNADGINKTIQLLDEDFEGLCFINLVDFDMLYGHRNDVDGYAKALAYFDDFMPRILTGLRPDDLVMVTADHGCDPATPSTDHSREYVPWVIAGSHVKEGTNLGTKPTFATIAATILDYLDVAGEVDGESVLADFIK